MSSAPTSSTPLPPRPDPTAEDGEVVEAPTPAPSDAAAVRTELSRAGTGRKPVQISLASSAAAKKPAGSSRKASLKAAIQQHLKPAPGGGAAKSPTPESSSKSSASQTSSSSFKGHVRSLSVLGAASANDHSPADERLEEPGRANSLEISIAGISTAAAAALAPLDTVASAGDLERDREGDASKDGTPPPVFRKRSATQSPRKTSGGRRIPSNPTAAADASAADMDEDTRAAIELLKNEVVVAHPSPSNPPLPLKTPSSATSSSLPLPSLPVLPIEAQDSAGTAERSRSPPKRSPSRGAHDHDGGLPYGRQNDEAGANTWKHDRYEDTRSSRDEPGRWGPRDHDSDRRRDPYRDRDSERRDVDYGRSRDSTRYAPRANDRYDSRYSRSPERHSTRHDSRSHRHSDHHDRQDRSRRYDHDRDDRRRRDDDDRTRPSKRQKRSESPNFDRSRRQGSPRNGREAGDRDGHEESRRRSPSRTPMSDDVEDEEEEGEVGKLPTRASVLGRSEQIRFEQGLQEKYRGNGERKDEDRLPSTAARGDPDRIATSNTPSHNLPPRPGHVGLPPPAGAVQSAPRQSLPESNGPSLIRMGPRFAPSTNGSAPPGPSSLPPRPPPARPSYGSAVADLRQDREALPAPATAVREEGEEKEEGEEDEAPRGEYPIPPPAPYHLGGRPTDPIQREGGGGASREAVQAQYDSPSASKGRNTPIVAVSGSLTELEHDAQTRVRTLAGNQDLWIEPPSPSTPEPETATMANGAEAEVEQEHEFYGASHISEYTLQQKLGEGTFGVVYKGVRGKEGDGDAVSEAEREKENLAWAKGLRVRKGDVVALKQIIFHNEGDGLPITSVREIRILKQLDHPNVVPVVDMALDPGDPTKFEVGRTFMVFPYMDHDLAGLLENPQVKLEIGEIKQYGKQLLEGTAYLHRSGILHRDMKAANLLINNEGILMIADFGLARSMEPPEVARDYTSCVVTRWYRPPELLLGERKYHYPVDMWGVGCILLEMFKRSPVFPGNSDLHQAQLIFAACGPPTEQSMPGWNLLPGVEGIDKSQQQWSNGPRLVRANASHYDTEVFADLIDKILVLDPKRRLTATEALDHDWFWTEPFPTEPSRMRQFMSSHEYDRRKLKENQQAAFGHVPPQQAQPQPMVQPRPQPMAPIGYNGPPPAMQYAPPVGAYNAPPPPPMFNGPPIVGMGMRPSLADGAANYGGPQPPQYGQGPPNHFAANRPPPATIQQSRYPGQGHQPLDYGAPPRQNHYQPAAPSWIAHNRPGPAVADPVQGRSEKVNLMQRLKKKG